MFNEKIEFDGENYRTKNYNNVLNLIYQETSKLQGEKDTKKGEKDTSLQPGARNRTRTYKPCSTRT